MVSGAWRSGVSSLSSLKSMGWKAKSIGLAGDEVFDVSEAVAR